VLFGTLEVELIGLVQSVDCGCLSGGVSGTSVAYNSPAVESWYKVTLSDADIAASRHAELQNTFKVIFMANGRPKGAAMFVDLDSIQGHHFYFPPGAAKIARVIIQSFAGIQCPAPSLSSVGLLVGNAGWRTTFFPEPER